jgi:hypothetical protein
MALQNRTRDYTAAVQKQAPVLTPLQRMTVSAKNAAAVDVLSAELPNTAVCLIVFVVVFFCVFFFVLFFSCFFFIGLFFL